MTDITPIPAFADNYIWALANGQYAVVVDPGDAAPVFAWLAQRALSLSGIVVTHHHADHVGGIADLRRRYKNVPVYGPAGENIPERTHALREGDIVRLPELGDVFTVWEVPGHTAGHIAYISPERAFVGDTLFAAGCGRIFEGTPAQLYAALTRLAGLPDVTQMYCTHEYTLSNLRFALAVDGENPALIARAFAAQAQRERGEPTVPFSMAIERETNPFLRAHVPALAQSAAAFAGEELTTPLAVFTALRAWKNVARF